MAFTISYEKQVEIEHRQYEERRKRQQERVRRNLDAAKREIAALRAAGYPNPIRAWSFGIRANA